VKKILELDAVKEYNRTGTLCWNSHCLKRSQLNPKWLAQAFTQPQIRFLEKHSYAARPHPKNNTIIEIFINEHTLEEQDHTVMSLLF